MGKTKSPPKPADVRTPAPPAAVPDTLPLARLRPSAENPRKTFDDLDGLAASIREHGVLQPLLVRPVGPNPRHTGKGWEGVDFFEVVAGERRLRAAPLAGLAEVPVTVRVLTDEQARPLRHVENEQRADVRPSETAAAYARLAETLTAEQIAATVGKPLGYVREFVRLARLPAWALAAVDAGVLPRATAALAARVPGEAAREKAAAQVLTGTDDWGAGDGYEKTLAKLRAGKTPAEIYHNWYGPKSYREAKEAIARYHTRQLKGSPFSLKLADQPPGAPSCEACPSRAGNNDEAKADGVRADVCLDPDCYRGKVEAYRTAELKKAADRGAVPVPDEFTWLTTFGDNPVPPKGWCLLGVPATATELRDDWPPGKAPALELVKVLGRDCPQQHVAFGRNGKPVLLVKTADARRALMAAGVLKKPERSKPAVKAAPKATAEWMEEANRKPPPGFTQEEWDRTREQKEPAGEKPADPRPLLADEYAVDERAAEIAARVLGEFVEGNTEDIDHITARTGDHWDTSCVFDAVRWLVRFLIRDHRDFGEERWCHVRTALGLPAGSSDEKAAVAAAEKLTPRQLYGLAVRLAAAPVLAAEGGAKTGFAAEILDWADMDWPNLQDQARRELAGGPTADERLAAAEAAQEAAPAAEPSPSTGEEAPAPAVAMLQDLDVPAAVLDLLEEGQRKRLRTVGAVWESCREATPELAELPPRNRLMAWLVKLGAKARPADQAAEAIARALPEEAADVKEGAA